MLDEGLKNEKNKNKTREIEYPPSFPPKNRENDDIKIFPLLLTYDLVHELFDSHNKILQNVEKKFQNREVLNRLE